MTAVSVTGISGIIGQLILLRELLIVSSGNELSIGIILANWLILEAFGSFVIGKRAEKSAHPLVTYTMFAVLFSISLPVMIYASRMMRPLLGFSIAQPIGITPILYSSFIILLPVSVLHGALFTYGCKIYASCTHNDAVSVGKVYVAETAGTFIGGAAWTYILLSHGTAWDMAGGIAVVNGGICVLLLAPRFSQGGTRERIWGAVSLLLCAAAGTAVLGGVTNTLHQRSVESQWNPLNIVHYEHTRYSNIGVVELDGQYTFFLDGLPRITAPIPDILSVEEFVHIPLLSHDNPSDMLILSGGAGGIIHEALKHQSIGRIDYAELDPRLIALLKQYPTQLTLQELKDPRLDVRHIDGRLFLQTVENTYDVILVGVNEPSDLQTNRYFTREFYHLASQRLNNAGILVFSVPGSLTYLNEDLRDLNASIYHTVTDVFSYVRVIPGEGSNLFLASEDQNIFTMDEFIFARRAHERGLASQTLVPRHIRNKLHTGWMGWFEEFIHGHTEKRNLDFTPVGVFYSASHWNAVFSPALQGLFQGFSSIDIKHIILVCIVIILGILTASLKKPNCLGSGISATVGTTGFTGMVFDLSLIFAFQAMYGYVFAWIGLLITAFMVGSAVGAFTATSLLFRIKNHRRVFIVLDMMIMGYALILPLLITSFQPLMTDPEALTSFRSVILLLSLVSGTLIGAQYPLANQMYLKKHGNVSRSAGLLYGSDLVGGWLGGITGGVILLPVLGLFGTCLTAVLLKACSFTILAVHREI